MNCKTHEHAKYLLVVLSQIHDTIVTSGRFEMAIDINTETVDRKDTFHSMARAVFQLQTEGSDETSVDQVKIKCSQNKSLPVDEQTMSLMSCLPSQSKKGLFAHFGLAVQLEI
jgi:hypothetical protein